MSNLDHYKGILKELEGKPLREKNIRVAGIVTEYVKEKHGISLIVVGGLSVEFYTDGGYATQDIDFVGAGHEEIMQCLVDLGFQREGKDSVHEGLEVYVEVPSSTLKSGDEDLVNTFKTVDGLTVNFIGTEDIFWDRIRSFVHWEQSEEIIWLQELYERHKNTMNFEYLKNQCNPEELLFLNMFIEEMESADLMENVKKKFKRFMDDNQISYSEVKPDIIAFNVSDGYVGVTFTPILMHYNYNDSEDEPFVSVQDSEMSVKQFISYFETYGGKEKEMFEKVSKELERLFNSK